jgi:ubiquinone/menaquinone biosynthesis C-methylase UbiE
MQLHVCPSWLSFSLDNSIRTFFQDPEKITRDYVKPGFTVLDIGCGPGYFTIPMARMAGKAGSVIAVDIQERMLEKMKERAAGHDVLDRIRAVQCRPDDIMVRESVDFVLTFWMVHEVPEKLPFLKQIAAVMKKDSRYLLAEPKVHVSKKQFREIAQMAADAGLKTVAEPAISLSRAMLFSL